MKLKSFDSDIVLYSLISFLAIVVFIAIYGTKVINPIYTDWLLEGGDLSQHYLGWRAYRESAWHFPIGMVDNLAYPYLTSVIFTDSIPLFAFLFKIISPVLPYDFQYFGIWGIICFVLQGIFTVKIVKQYTENEINILLCSLLTIMTPVMIYRMYTHTALAGQWIILYCLELLINRQKYDSYKKICTNIALVGLFSASVHIYFVLTSGIIISGICLLDILENKRIVRSLIVMTDFIFVVAAVVALFGGFSSGMSPKNVGLGIYSFNINGFLNPQGWSCILQDHPLYGIGQYEGFGYLGFGFILLLFLGIALFLGQSNLRAAFKSSWKIMTALTFVFLAAFIVALSPVIACGDYLLIEMKLPKLIVDVWSVFRASGRIIWVSVYVIEICTFLVLIKNAQSSRFVTVVLTMALMVQLFDIHEVLAQKYISFSKKVEYTSTLSTSAFWDMLGGDDNIQHLVYYSLPEQKDYYSLTDWALDNDKTVSNFYFARSIDDKVIKYRDRSLLEASADNVYVFPENAVMNCLKYSLNYYHIDDLIVGYKDLIEGFKTMDESEYYLEWIFSDNTFLNKESGVDTENGREIYAGGTSNGPCWSVPSGKYQVTINGSDIPKELDIVTCSGQGKISHEHKISERTDKKITLEVSLESDVTDLEIVLKNNSGRSAVVKSMDLRCVLR